LGFRQAGRKINQILACVRHVKASDKNNKKKDRV
jgi:hypothetical protein